MKAAKAFIPVKLDTKNGRYHTKKFNVKRNRSYLIFQDYRGKELARIENPKGMEAILAQMKKVAVRTSPNRPQVIHYALTYRVIDKVVREHVGSLVNKLGDDDWETRDRAEGDLLRLGYPAYVTLLKRKKDVDLEVRMRIDRVVTRLRVFHDLVENRGLDHDVEYLHRLKNDKARARLRAILPSGVKAADWKNTRARYFWNPKIQKYQSRD